MKIVITFGVFDYFHYGHLKLLKRCKNLGNYLIVAIHKDEDIKKTKPGTKVLYSLEKRLEMLDSLKCVDEVVSYSSVDEDIKRFDFDILVVGPDQTHDGFKRAIEWCKQHKKEVVVLERTPGISSSQLRKGMN